MDHYSRRSEAFYRLADRGFVDGEQDVCSCRSCVGDEVRERIVEAHRILGRAIEAEVFGDRRQPRVDASEGR